MTTNKASAQSTYDIRVVNADTVMDKKIVKDVAPKEGESTEDGDEWVHPDGSSWSWVWVQLRMVASEAAVLC